MTSDSYEDEFNANKKMVTLSLPSQWRWLLLLVGLVLGGLLFYGQGGFNPMLGRDINQHRLDVALPTPTGAILFEQSFSPTKDGLAALEIMLTRPSEPEADESGQLTIELYDEAGQLVAIRVLNSSRYQHNQTFRLTFPPQTNSANQQFTLKFSGNESNPLSIWGYRLDTIDNGAVAVQNGTTAAADIRLLTFSQLTTGLALQEILELLARSLPVLLTYLMVVLLPGLVVIKLLPGLARWDPAARWSLAVVLGLAIWPMIWLWPSLVGWRWGSWTLRIVIVAGWALYLVWQRRWPGPKQAPWQREHWLLLLVILIAVASRLLVIRDQSFPLWVDSSRHSLIVELLRLTGRFPTSYQPLLPVDLAGYHYGFHIVPATMQLINPWQSHSVLLYLGQYLNALVPLMAYSGLWLLTRNRRVAIFSAFLIALPFFFPGYYATWGRFTQLTGMLLMPLLLALTWNLIRGARGQRLSFWQDSRVWLIAILAGGLLLIHVRVFLLYIPFVGVVWLLNGGRQGRRLALAGVGAILLILPQFIRLLSFVRPDIVFAPIQGPANVFPTSYLNIGWETQILYVAGGLFSLALLASREKQRWLYLPVTLLAWVALLFLSLAGENIGLPQSWLINLNSMYITLFLPLAWLMALSLQAISSWLKGGHWIVQTIAYVAVGIMLIQAATFGWQQQVTLLNDTTMLAQTPDEAGLSWLDDHLPAAAIVAHGSWDWLGGVWAGSDGGAWILPATGRFSTTPPVDHSYDATLWVEVQEFNRAAQAIQDWSDPAATDWLKGQDVSHIYIGARGGYLEPYQLAQNPNTELLYAADGVFIFTLR